MYSNLPLLVSQQQYAPPMMAPGFPCSAPPQMVPVIMGNLVHPGFYTYGPSAMAPLPVYAQQITPEAIIPSPLHPVSTHQMPPMATTSASSSSTSSSTRTSRSSSFSSTSSGENGKKSSSNEDKENFKTRLCYHFSKSGRCPKGNECGFAHGEEELLTLLSSAPFPFSAPSTSQDISENEAPKKFKIKLCVHFANSGRCPKRNACGFAHGAHELQASQRTLEKRELNSKHKTRLCDHFAKGGSQDCPYRYKCEFVHPSDKEYYLEWYADTEEFNQKQQEWKDKVQEQHKRKSKNTPLHQEHAIDQGILRMVKAWNKGHPKGPHYYDLHGLTVFMAERYLTEIINDMVTNGVERARIETGRGTHSTNGIAAIRTRILANYQGLKGASFAPEEHNDGVLVLTFPKHS